MQNLFSEIVKNARVSGFGRCFKVVHAGLTGNGMASYLYIMGVDVARPSVSLSPYLEVVTGEAQLKLGLTAYALRAGNSDLAAASILSVFIGCRGHGFDKGKTPDIPLDELLSRAMPL